MFVMHNYNEQPGAGSSSSVTFSVCKYQSDEKERPREINSHMHACT